MQVSVTSADVTIESQTAFAECAKYPFLDRLVHDHLARCSEGLHNCGLAGAKVILSGSYATGHFTGEKEKALSFCETTASQPGFFTEIDVRILLPTSRHPWDPAVQALLKKALHTGPDIVLSRLPRWGREIDSALLFGHDTLPGGTLLEWEYACVSQPFIEPALLWKFFFPPEEIAEQTLERALVRPSGREPLSKTKDKQHAELLRRFLEQTVMLETEDAMRRIEGYNLPVLFLDRAERFLAHQASRTLRQKPLCDSLLRTRNETPALLVVLPKEMGREAQL